MQEIILYNGEAEDMELRRLAYKVDARRNRAAREAAELRAQRAERKVAQMKKERMELAAFVSVIALVVVMGVCITAAPAWTAAFPFAGALAVMRKVGWLKNG